MELGSEDHRLFQSDGDETEGPFEFEAGGSASGGPPFCMPVQFELVVNLDPYRRMIIDLFLEGPPEGCDQELN